jgi:hypothetical protein
LHCIACMAQREQNGVAGRLGGVSTVILISRPTQVPLSTCRPPCMRLYICMCVLHLRYLMFVVFHDSLPLSRSPALIVSNKDTE